MKKISFIFITFFFLNPAFSQNWTGAINSDWNNPSNWSTIPSSGDDIEIDPVNYTGAMAHPIVNVNSNFTPAELLVQNGAQLTISAILNTTDRAEIIGNGTIVTITNSGAFSLIGTGNNARLIFVEDAHLEMSGGSLSCGQRLLFELGATGTINSGTITVGETLALVDGSPLGSSKLIQNGGTITTNAGFGFENEAGVYYPTFEQTGGTIHINGSLVWLGAAPGAGKGYFRSSGGSVFITGIIENDPTSTMGMQLELNGSSTVLENSGTTIRLLAGDSIILADSATWKDLSFATWFNNGVIHGTSNSIFQCGNTTFTGNQTSPENGIYQLEHLTVPAGKYLNHVSPPELRISGNMTVSGSFSHNANQLTLNGSKNQTIDHSSNNLILHGLQVKNRADGPSDGGYGISLNTTVSISQFLNLYDGIIVSAPGKITQMGDNVYLSGQSDSTFITGYVQKTGDDSFTFPVGSIPDRYRPFTISSPASPGSQVKVGYFNSAYSTLTPVENPLLSVSSLEYWDFTNSSTTDSLTVAVEWNDASQSGLTNCNDISLTVWDGTKWAFIPSITNGLCNGSNQGSLSGSIPLPTDGPITIGFTSNVTQQHITLCAGDSLTVGLNTYNQSGTYFDIFQDINGDDSTVITVITVLVPIIQSVTDNITSITLNAPTANTVMWINCLDGTTAAGTGNFAFTFTPEENGNYAVIAGHNGCVDTSDCIVIDQLGLSEFNKNKLEMYPNPVTKGGHLVITSTSTQFVIQSLDGKIIQPKAVIILDGKCELDLPILSSGLYLIRETGSGNKNPQTGRFKVD